MRKRQKLLLIIVLIIVSVFTIYKLFNNDKISYIALGDSLAEGMNPYGEVSYGYADFIKESIENKNKLENYTKEYTETGYTTEDIINELKLNSELKRNLRESDLVTISIGANDFLNSINIRNIKITDIPNYKTKIEEIIPKIDKCIEEIRKYAKEELIIVGYYNPIPFLFNTSGNDLDTIFAYIDEEYNKIAEKYSCKYVSLYQLFKNNTNYLPNPTDIHPSIEGYQAIANEILKVLDTK